jgi:uncharacterized protein YidB (DUF937 family)
MGLMDILNGMQNGPRGQTQPASPGTSSGGMSPVMMALLGLLAYKAMKGGGLGNILGGSPQASPSTPSGPSGGLGDVLGGLLGGSRGPQASPGATTGGGLFGGSSPTGRPMSGGPSGGLGDILGGLLGGPNAGNALNTGLRNLVGDLEDNGQGDVAKSWISRGDNKPIAPNDLANALGSDTIDQLSTQTGMPRDQLLSELSQNLPHLVDKLTPDGRLPTEQEASRW